MNAHSLLAPDEAAEAQRINDLDEAITALHRWLPCVSDTLTPGLEFAIGVLLSVRDDRDPQQHPAGAR